MQLKASLGYMRLSQRESVNIFVTPPPSCSLQWPLSPHRGRCVNCTVKACLGAPPRLKRCPPRPASVLLKPSQQVPCPAPHQPQCNMPFPWGPLARYCLCRPSLTPSSSLPVVKKSHGTPLPLLFLLLNPFCKLQTSCVLLIRTRDPGSSAHVVWCLTIQVQCPLGTNQWGLSLQQRQMYAAQVPAPPVTPLFLRSVINL